MEYVNKIPKSDLEAIAYASENMTEGDLAETIHKTLEKNCAEQTRGVINPADGLELLPVIPVVCSDGNCRSHKEKVNIRLIYIGTCHHNVCGTKLVLL